MHWSLERAEVRGICPNRGYIPTKTMIASARVAYLARSAATMGYGRARSR